MEHTCSECLSRGKMILMPAIKITNHMVPWEKRYVEGSQEASKEKAYIAKKMS